MNQTDTHKEYARLLHDDGVNGIICTGPAGTGKTFGAVKYAVHCLKDSNKAQVVLARPPAPYEMTMGFGKGDTTEKLAPWLQSMYGVMREIGIKTIDIERWREDGHVIEQTIEHIQGRTFHDSVILIDEAENLSYKALKMLATRVGRNSKLILMGDISQAAECVRHPGLDEFVEMIAATGNSTKVVEMTMADCMRSDYAKEMLESDEAWQQIKKERAL